MLYENWLHNGSLNIKTFYCEPLKNDITSDCLVIGGGIAGLHAALRLVDSGKKVVLLEKRICGGSSSGQSGGFLSPESEEDMSALMSKYSEENAKKVYRIAQKGFELIIDNIKKHNFNCDLRVQDTFFFSSKESHNETILEEAKAKDEENLSHKVLGRREIMKVHPGKNYKMALLYPGSYGINSFAYCQEMKNLLLKKGVKIYEGSEVRKINGNTAVTHLGSVKAKNIIICVDKMKKDLDEDFSKKYYHIQTYIAVSEPLTDEEMKSLFPKKELMCWDTDWNYVYYRPVEGNRLLVGGSSAMTAYMPEHYYSPKIIIRFIEDLKENFPKIKDIEFTHYWSGLIDATKDLVPIADYDPKNKSIQFSLGCTGLNWAAYCGDYLARRIIDKKTKDLTEFLGANRKFWISDSLQKVLGKRISFSLSHLKHFLG